MAFEKLRRGIVCVAVLSCVFLIVFFSDSASDAAYNAMNECAFAVIPSLFPYMVLSSLIVTTGTATTVANIIGKPVAKLLGVPPCSVSAILMGMLCGFPIGAKASMDMYRAGLLTDKETEHLIAISNNTGPAFVIEVAGRKYFGSSYIGVIFYAIQLVAAFIVAFIYGRIDKKKMNCKKSHAGISSNDSVKPASGSFASAVADAARSSVVVSGFIVFFSVISEYVYMLGDAIGLSGVKISALNALIEFSGAVKDASVYAGTAGLCIAAFAINFGGLSVLAQSAALTDGASVSMKKCFVCKLIQGITSAVLTFIISQFGLFKHSTASANALPVWKTGTITLPLLFFMFLCVLFNTLKCKKDVFRK